MTAKQQQPKRKRGRPPGHVDRRAVMSHMRVTTAKRVKKAARDQDLSMSQWIERACVHELERGNDGKA